MSRSQHPGIAETRQNIKGGDMNELLKLYTQENHFDLHQNSNLTTGKGGQLKECQFYTNLFILSHVNHFQYAGQMR